MKLFISEKFYLYKWLNKKNMSAIERASPIAGFSLKRPKRPLSGKSGFLFAQGCAVRNFYLQAVTSILPSFLSVLENFDF